MNINDVSEAFDDWLEPITIERKLPDGYSRGVLVPGGLVNPPPVIQAVVQNADGDDLEVLPEGLKNKLTIKLHTTSELRSVVETDDTNADIVQYNDKRYKVYIVFDRKIGNYYKAIATRVL